MTAGKELAAFRGNLGSATLSPDGKRLASAGGYRGKGEIKIWEMAELAERFGAP